MLSSGLDLPSHSIYGPGTSFLEWDLGDFTEIDSPIGDYSDAFPTSFPSMGQVNVYTVSVTGYTEVHFDAYDSILLGANQMMHAKFVPPSHDAGTAVPEPGGLLLFSVGLLVVGRATRRR